MKIQSYNNMKVTTNWCTPHPGMLVRQAMDMTMGKKSKGHPVSQKTLQFLFEAEHTSIIEHAVICFTVTSMSRSLLAQLTRHRIASYTSASQHYQDYRDYPHMVHGDLCYDSTVGHSLGLSEEAYIFLISQGTPKEEARQVLTNAKAVDLMVTMNAVSIYNLFRKRTCLRNVEEMLIFCYKLWAEIAKWWSELSDIIGPPCQHGKCNQGHMSCGKGKQPWKDNQPTKSI